MNGERAVLHLNAADFAVAVERVVDRTLCSRPVIVAPLQSARAVVHDMSEEAYRDGVRKGMLLREAVRRCRSAQVLPLRLDVYRKAMAVFVGEAREYTPVLESGAEDGHLFLDVTGTYRLFGTPPDIGWRLRRKIREKTGIDPIWSLGSNKLVAKVASRLVKPVGEYIVAPGEEELFLAPVPLILLPGLTVPERKRLEEFNIWKTGDLAVLSRKQLYCAFGSRGGSLYDISRGVDPDPVRHESGEAAVAREHVFAEDSNEKKIIEGVVMALAARIGMVLREKKINGRRMGLQLDYSDGGRVIRQATSRQGVADDATLQEMALTALGRAWRRRTRVRGCCLCCDRLGPASPQLQLFSELQQRRQAKDALMTAMDIIRRRFGENAVRRAGQAVLQ